jgi:hypothetical protein
MTAEVAILATHFSVPLLLASVPSVSNGVFKVHNYPKFARAE